MRPPKQDKISRYARYCLRQPSVWVAILAMAYKHWPSNMRQWASDILMLRVVEMERGIR